MSGWSGRRSYRYRARRRNDTIMPELNRLLLALVFLALLAVFGTTIITTVANSYARAITRGTGLEDRPRVPAARSEVAERTTRAFKAPAFAQTRSFPRSGSFFLTDYADKSRPEVPLELKGSASALAAFVVMLHDIESGHDVAGAFVKGNEVARVNIPSGRYRVRIASGQWMYWSGMDGLFGSGTGVEELRGTLDLKRSGGLSLDVTPRTFSVTPSGDPIALTDA